MKSIHIHCLIIISITYNRLNGENSVSFTEFSHDRVHNAVREINELYSTKNKKVTAKIAGIGLATTLGYLYLQQDRSGTALQPLDKNLSENNQIDALRKIIIAQNSWAAKAKDAVGTTAFSGILWCIQDIWKQFFDKPEYDYFKKSFYYFDVHLTRIKNAAEVCEKDSAGKNLEFFRSELIASFNDMVNSLEEIIGVIDFISVQENLKSERIVLYKKYIVEQVTFLGRDLDGLLMRKQETSFITVAAEGTTEITITLQKLINLYPKLTELQKENIDLRVKKMDAKIDAIGNFLLRQAEREQ